MAGANKTLSRKLEGEKWTPSVARVGFPILVRQAHGTAQDHLWRVGPREISKTLGAPRTSPKLEQGGGIDRRHLQGLCGEDRDAHT